MGFRTAVWCAAMTGVVTLPCAMRAQEPLTRPAPLVAASSPVTPARVTATMQAAERAHDFGQLSVAVTLYRELLALPSGTGQPLVDRAAVGLALASVLLDAGEAAEAERVLQSMPPPHTPAWHLRTGLAAMQLRKRDLAQSSWEAIKPEDLSPEDRTWHTFLLGALYDTAPTRDITKANELYGQAEAAAPNALARARFQLAAERVRLRIDPPSAEVLEQTRRNAELNQGRVVGYQFAFDYAVMLARSERRGDAVRFLRQQLVPPGLDRGWRDDFNLLIGLIGDRTRTGEGRAALMQLLTSGSKPERQRQALDLLASASRTQPERGLFSAELNRLIAATPPHPIRETLLYFRAQLALTDRQFAAAENDANQLVRDFPGSPLRVHAFGILTQSAWEQGRYRLAADHARKAREALPPGTAGRARAELGVLEAEARFRAGLQAERVDRTGGGGRVDFRQAADAYAAVLRERPAELEAPELARVMFLRVVAEIKAASPDAAKILDELAQDPVFDLEHRWQAEWSLAQAWKVEGRASDAFARVSRLLAETGAAAAQLPAELRARIAWLQARLAFDAQQFSTALTLMDGVLASLGDRLAPTLRNEIASTTILLKARAELALQREGAALETLKKLREDHGATDAAVYSHLIEASHYEAQGKISEAQLRLTRLVDNQSYKGSPYVPYALFELARLSELLGREQDLRAANQRIEDLIEVTRTSGQDDLVFAARLKQGDLLRRLNNFAAAQQTYEYLINNYAHRPDVVLAHLALAECHNAQSSSDPAGPPEAQAHANFAQLKFEELRDRADAPPDVRVEAGYNLGKLLERRGRPEDAAVVWWRDVIEEFLLKSGATPIEMGAKRPWWLARTLLDLGELREREGKLEQAKDAYLLLLRSGLGHGESLARKNLERLGVPTSAL